MAQKRVNLLAADPSVDDTTGALLVTSTDLAALAACISAGRVLVNAAGITLTTDMIDLDVQAITGAGAAAKSLADVNTSVGGVTTAVGTANGHLSSLAGCVSSTRLKINSAGASVACGSKVVNIASATLVAASTPCRAVWLGAPLTAADIAANTRPVYVGDVTTRNIPVMPANFEGVTIPIDDAVKLYVSSPADAQNISYAIFA